MKMAIVSQPLDDYEPPVDGGGSIPILTYHLATLLAERGHHVTVYAYAKNNAQTQRLKRISPKLNHRFIYVGSRSRLYRALMKVSRRASSHPQLHKAMAVVGRASPIRRTGVPFVGSFLYNPVYAIRVALDVRRRGIEIVHIHNFSQYAPIIRALCPKAKIFLHMNCEWLNQFPRATIRSRLRSVDLVLCCSDYIRDRALEIFPDMNGRVLTLYNGVDTDRFGQALAGAGGHDVYCIGRVSPEKGMHILIEAFRDVIEQVAQARLFIVGPPGVLPRSFSQAISDDPILHRSAGKFYEEFEEPPYPEMLQKEMAGLPNGGVQFLGNLSHSDLIERLRSAALVVQPSLWREPFGMPAAEAMAMGLPVVVTRAGGLPEIVQDGKTGIIVDRGSPSALAAAIIDLLRSPERRRTMGVAARRRALERFAFRVLVAQLEQHYQAALGQPDSRSETSKNH